jgi:hypothetical protein
MVFAAYDTRMLFAYETFSYADPGVNARRCRTEVIIRGRKLVKFQCTRDFVPGDRFPIETILLACTNNDCDVWASSRGSFKTIIKIGRESGRKLWPMPSLASGCRIAPPPNNETLQIPRSSTIGRTPAAAQGYKVTRFLCRPTNMDELDELHFLESSLMKLLLSNDGKSKHVSKLFFRRDDKREFSMLFSMSHKHRFSCTWLIK